jgi:histone-lysine N-methyltransferase SETD2
LKSFANLCAFAPLAKRRVGFARRASLVGVPRLSRARIHARVRRRSANRVAKCRIARVTARRRSIDDMAPSDALTRLLEETPLTTDAWVQCDSCETWRRVPRVVADRLGENTAWFCHQNLDQKFSTCDDAQELEDDEIDALMRAQEAAMATRTAAVAPRAVANAHEWYAVRRNIFAHRAPRKLTEDDVMICACAPEAGMGCGSDCLNRLVLSECDPAHCPCGSACGNQRMSRGESKATTVRRTGKKGHGLFAAEDVGAGEFVCEYVGEVLHEEAYKERKQRYQDEGRSHYYFMTLSSSETIDATIRGNTARFLNHSCAPNCETQKWMVRGELCIGIFATRDIAEGEELTIDYKFERFGEKPSRCFCMAGACCGWIGGAKAAEAAKAYNVDGDDDDDAGHEDDPEPVMREIDESIIAQEEARGREEMADKYAPKKSVVKAENKSWRPPEEVREMERQRKATERDENRAARAARSTDGAGSNVRRAKIPAGSYAHKWSAMSAGAKKRTEVDLTMEELQSTTGGLRSKEAVSHCVQLFNLCYPVDADGVTQINTRDLGLILEAISLTKNPSLQQELVGGGIMSCFQKCINVLGGPTASAAHAALQRKILKILMDLMLHFKEFVITRIGETRTAAGTLMQAIGDLRVANDTPLMKLARDFEYKYVGTGVMGPMPERPRAQPQQQQLRRNDSGSGGGWGMRSSSTGSLNRYGGAPAGSVFNGGAPPRSVMSGGRGGFNGSAPPRSAMSDSNRRGGGYGGGYGAPAPRQSSLSQAMRPQAHAYPPQQRSGGWGPPPAAAPTPSSYDDGRGIKREREEPPRPPQQPRAAVSKPLLTQPLPAQFDDPRSELFADAITAFVTMEVEDLRAPSHPLHDPRANYDRLTQRWALEALEKEHAQWNGGDARPLPVSQVRARVVAHVKSAARAS